MAGQDFGGLDNCGCLAALASGLVNQSRQAGEVSGLARTLASQIVAALGPSRAHSAAGPGLQRDKLWVKLARGVSECWAVWQVSLQAALPGADDLSLLSCG